MASVEEPLTSKLERLVTIWEVVRIEEFVSSPYQQHLGRPEHDRRKLARCFLAKAVYNLSTTEALIDVLRSHRALRRLCGFESVREIPSSATFSRAFAQFAQDGLGDRVHVALVKTHVSDHLVMHLSRDSTEVVAREKAIKTEEKKEEKPVPRKRGRPPKTAVVVPKEPTRLEQQLSQTFEEALADLPRLCDWGTKKDTGGHKHTWKGWKAHIDWTDDNIPVNVVTTSASLHDSQVAIPMARQTAERVTAVYTLMDSAYDAGLIRQVCAELDQVALIDPNPRRGGVPAEHLFDPPMARRYQERTTAERGNSRLKDEFGLRQLRVRGHAKAHLHIMFGILSLFANQLLKPWSG